MSFESHTLISVSLGKQTPRMGHSTVELAETQFLSCLMSGQAGEPMGNKRKNTLNASQESWLLVPALHLINGNASAKSHHL